MKGKAIPLPKTISFGLTRSIRLGKMTLPHSIFPGLPGHARPSRRVLCFMATLRRKSVSRSAILTASVCKSTNYPELHTRPNMGAFGLGDYLAQNRFRISLTCVAAHVPPRAVGIRRRFRASAVFLIDAPVA